MCFVNNYKHTKISHTSLWVVAGYMCEHGEGTWYHIAASALIGFLCASMMEYSFTVNSVILGY